MRRTALLAPAFILAIIAQTYLARGSAAADAVLLYVLAGLTMAAALGVAAWPAQTCDGAQIPEQAVSAVDRRRGRLMLAAALAIGITAALPATADWQRSLQDAAVLLCVASLLAAYGFSRTEGWRWRAKIAGLWAEIRQKPWEALAVLAILAFGAFTRLWQLEYYPPPNGAGIVDEPQIGKMAIDALRGQRPWQFASLVYPSAILFHLFTPSMLLLRLPTAFAGIAILLPFYLLARQLTGAKAALAAMLLFAASRWHVTITRVILPVDMEALIEMCAIYLLYRGFQTGGGFSFVLAGGLTAAGLYGYAGYRVVPIIVLVLVALVGIRRTIGIAQARSTGDMSAPRAVMRSYLRGLAAFTAGAAVVLWPFLGIVRRDPGVAFTERVTSVIPLATAPDKLQALAGMGERVQAALLLFNGQGDPSPLYNIPNAPLLDPISALLFGIGLICALVFVWRGETALPVVWFGLTLVTGAILTNSLTPYRILGLAPAIFLLIAFVVSALDRRFKMSASSRYTVFNVTLGVALVAACYVNIELFFGRQIHREDVRREFTHATELAAAYIAGLPDKPYIHLIATIPFYNQDMDYGWMAGFPRGRRSLRLGDALPHREDAGDTVYLFAQPYADAQLAKTVADVYPHADCQSTSAPWGAQLFVACKVPAADVQAQRGLAASYVAESHDGGAAILTRTDAALDFTWDAASAPGSGPFSAEWRGSFYQPASGPVTLGVTSTAPFTMVIGGLQLDSRTAPTATASLAQGWHPLTARLSGAFPGGETRLFRVSPDGRQPINEAAFSTIVIPHGLLGRFQAGQNWQGPILLERIDPVMDFLGTPESPEGRPSSNMPAGAFSGEWTAHLSVPSQGVYRFQANAVSGLADVSVDDKVIARTAPAPPEQTASAEGSALLSAGDHLLRFRYAYREGPTARAWLYWAPPGQEMGAIPSELLTPIPP